VGPGRLGVRRGRAASENARRAIPPPSLGPSRPPLPANLPTPLRTPPAPPPPVGAGPSLLVAPARRDAPREQQRGQGDGGPTPLASAESSKLLLRSRDAAALVSLPPFLCLLPRPCASHSAFLLALLSSPLPLPSSRAIQLQFLLSLLCLPEVFVRFKDL
jgi:hypothetical protein